MITSYEEFLVESAIYRINESDVTFSEKFASMLIRIDSPISKVLLMAQDRDRDIVNNYFDIDTSDTISFIPDRKVQTLEGKPYAFYRITSKAAILDPNPFFDVCEVILKGLKYDNVDEIISKKMNYKPTNDEFGEFVADLPFRHPNLVLLKYGTNFVIVRAEMIRQVDPAWVKHRQTIRVGRGIKALTKRLGYDFTDAQIEEFVNKWKAKFDVMSDKFRNFELVKGEEIKHWYDIASYENGYSGQLGKSCMATKSKDTFDLYSKNPEVCSLLILKSDKNLDKIIGRALVWNLNSGETFMDRVYTFSDSDIYLYREYAKSKNWHYKDSNDSDADCMLVGPDEKVTAAHLVVTIKANQYGSYYPYVDTIKYLTEVNQEFWQLSNIEDADTDWLLESTRGIPIPVRCRSCDGTGTVTCGFCDEGKITMECGLCDDGWVDCESCNGQFDEENCKDCSGIGKTECTYCVDGEITVECENCSGTGTLPCRDCS